MPRDAKQRRVCFVTGTRAEFGLMRSTMRALRDDPRIELQVVATGSHTQASRGATLGEIRRDGWRIDGTVPWPDDATRTGVARQTGVAMGRLAGLFERLDSDVVLVVGDRVEAFAAAAAAHVGGRVLAHVHGGDRAMGQVDDALRHAISKLAHLHFAATPGSGDRLFAMGEERSRIHVVGAPGVDGIRGEAASRATLARLALSYRRRGFVLLLLHPTDADDGLESGRTRMLIDAVRRTCEAPIVALLPNNDPGSPGIVVALHAAVSAGDVDLFTHVGRSAFLGLLRDCRLLVGNSSAGIIEAGSFGTPVVDVGPRQQGRERGGNVRHAAWTPASLAGVISDVACVPRVGRRVADNPYDRGGAARRIAHVLGGVAMDDALRRKVIRY